MKNSFFIFSLVFLISCESKGKSNHVNNDSKPIEEINSIEEIKIADEKLDFKSFIDKINKDCKYQKCNVQFPLQSIALIDFENNTYDTTYIQKKDYECMKFTSPKSNIMEGEVKLKYIHVSDSEEIIQLGVEDTGIHIQYFFTFKDGTWTLVKVLDEST